VRALPLLYVSASRPNWAMLDQTKRDKRSSVLAVLSPWPPGPAAAPQGRDGPHQILRYVHVRLTKPVADPSLGQVMQQDADGLWIVETDMGGGAAVQQDSDGVRGLGRA
jgi:hypothetical protein